MCSERLRFNGHGTDPTVRRRLVDMIVLVIGLLLLLHPRRAHAGPVAPERPNVVVILVDDLGYGDVSAYGAKDVQTPNMDALLGAGMRFTQFYANSPVCSPTRASLLTGRYPDRVGVHGVTNNAMFLSPNAVLLPELLQRAGYHTALTGKWHLGDASPNVPNERGFDYFKGTHYGMVRSYTRHAIDKGLPYGMWENDQPIAVEGHATDITTDWAIEYLQEHAGSDDPFFLYLSYHAPHGPIEPPEEYVTRLATREIKPHERRIPYVAMVEHLDDAIGRFVDAMKSTGVWENTFIVFASDNGPTNFGTAKPYRGYKRLMFEGGIRVPGGFVWPNHIEPGTTSDTAVMTIDVLPTLMDVLDLKLEHEIDGISIRPTLEGRPQAGTDRYLFWMRRPTEAKLHVQPYYAARYGDWKLLQNKPDETMRLYNLADDPYERKPLDKSYPAYGALMEALRVHVQRTGSIPWQRRGSENVLPRWSVAP